MQNLFDWFLYGRKRTIHLFMSKDLIPKHKRFRTPMTRDYLNKLIKYAEGSDSQDYSERLIRALKDGRVKAIEEVGHSCYRFGLDD